MRQGTVKRGTPTRRGPVNYSSRRVGVPAKHGSLTRHRCILWTTLELYKIEMPFSGADIYLLWSHANFRR